MKHTVSTHRPASLLLGSLLGALCAANLPAADIDAFAGSVPGQAVIPNVLIILDNSANWSATAANACDDEDDDDDDDGIRDDEDSDDGDCDDGGTIKKFTSEKAGLRAVFNGMATDADGSARFNVGLMMASETGNGNSGADGGYVRASLRPMTSATRSIYAEMINTLDETKDKANNIYAGLLMSEAHRYFSGGAPYAGSNKQKADYSGNSTTGWGTSYSTTASKAAMQAVYNIAPASGDALSARAAAAYTLPPQASGADCVQRNYIIYISNGRPNDDSGTGRTTALSQLTSAGGNTSQIPVTPSGSATNMSDEWARFLRQNAALGVVTYTVDVAPTTTGTGPAWSALLKSMAKVSDGKYSVVSNLNSNGTQISRVLNNILAEIQSVNSVYASVSLPVSVNTQGTYLNQVYIGMFRPDGGGFPRWPGNLKQYKLGLVSGQLRLLDAAGSQAINSNTGFIGECARSFWTPSTADSYWAFDPSGECPPPSGVASTTYSQSNYPDGNVVEKGGQGYLLRAEAPSSRVAQTCVLSGNNCSLIDLATASSAITTSLLGAADSTERTELINWARGVDVDDENTNASTTDMRPSAHGDVLHSRPVALNFGTDAAPKIVVFYGGNDGMFRAVNGNRTAAIGTTTAGEEFWSFMPAEFLPQIRRLRQNTQQINYRNLEQAGVTGLAAKPYGMDGVISAYKHGSTQYVVGAMRRGGRALYAFTASLSGSNALGMSLAWRAGCPSATSDTNCSSGLSGIGQTWSKPVAATVAGYSNPVLFVGGGYDECEDADPATCDSSAKGRAIYVLDATTGAHLQTLATDRSVIADVTIVNGADGTARYAYAADLGGNVYRMAVGSGAPSTWSITKIADLGCDTTASCTNYRKFMFAPDVIAVGDDYYLLLGSGDREKPLASYTGANSVANHFFMIKDKPTSGSWLSSQNATCGSAVICRNALVAVTRGTDPAADQVASKAGWYLQLDASESVVTTALTLFGTANFSTFSPYTPSATSCTSTLGTTRLYSVSYTGADSEREQLPAVGLPPSATGGMVTLDDGRTVPFCIGCSATSPLEASLPQAPASGSINRPKRRSFWFIGR